MWKNKHAGVSAKKPKKKKGTCESRSQPREWVADGKSYTQNDRVTWDEYTTPLKRQWIAGRRTPSREQALVKLRKMLIMLNE
ncbi:hypothetical protein LTR28_003918 [Elasticomyces elasticus]|nr:hypothetical protein LTR28_003918 [Elasticomyces elasticus]